MKLKARHIFFTLSTLFLLYSFSIYIKPLPSTTNHYIDINRATEGKLVWQKYNCQSCHQIFGLGGYLGPDLTNIISHPQKGEKVIEMMIKNGTKQMPAFNISNEEFKNLIEFLKATDASGISDPRTFTKNNFGMIEGYETKQN